jgi:tetratricopeptide (TPR) repeat protein
MSKPEGIITRSVFLATTFVKMLAPPLYSLKRLERHCKSYLARHPDARFARWVLADLYNKYGRYSEARREYEVLLGQGGDKRELNRLLGELCFKLEDYESSLRYLRAASSASANDRSHNYFVGTALMHVQQFEEAVQYLERAVALGLQDARLFGSLGWSYSRLGKFAESASWYRKAVALDPASARARNDAAKAHVYFANALLREGKKADAVTQLHKALGIMPEDSIRQAVCHTLGELGETVPLRQ